MKYSDIPTKFNIAFGASAGGGFIRTVPQASQIGVHDGWASLTDGFPPLNFLPIGSGGVPPFGQDMNGILNQITQWSRWQNAGGMVEYDAAFSTAVGGYPQGAILRATTLHGFWYCLVDDNTVNPDASANPFQQGWLFFGSAGQTALLGNVTFYVNPSTGNDSWDGSSATHTSGTVGPFATLTKALSVVSQFLPGTFGATINLAAGTYNAGAGSFQTATFAHCAVTIVGPGSTAFITGTGAACLQILGPNNYSLQNFSTGNTGSVANSTCIYVGPQAVATIATVTFTGNSSSTGNNVYANNGGLANITSMTANGNIGGGMFVADAGQVNLSGATVANTAITIGVFAVATNGGKIATQPAGASFPNAGLITGKRYDASLNAIINTGGGGANYFPGTVAGTTSTGGQYI